MEKVVRRNQVIATEGILPYKMDDGSIRFLFKKWDDLKKFIGKNIKVVDGHPPSGLIETNTKILKELEIRQCSQGKKALCVDYTLEENMPNRKGYSIGYVYEPADEEGIHNGKPYDGIQKIEFIDHLALTDMPRNPTTVVTDDIYGEIGNSIGNCNEEVNKKTIAFDSYRDFNKENPKVKVKAMTDEKDLLNEISSLKTEIATLKATQSATDAFAEEIDALEIKNAELQKELSIKVDAIKKYELLEEERKKLEMSKTVKYLEDHKISIDSLPDNNISFFEGIKWYLEHQKVEPSTSVDSKVTDEVRKTNIDGHEIRLASTNDYRWDKTAKKWVKKEGVN